MSEVAEVAEVAEEYVPKLGDKVVYRAPVGDASVDTLAWVVEVGHEHGTLLAVLTPFSLTWKRSDPGPGRGEFEVVG